MLGLLDRKKRLYKGEIVDLVERARVSEKASFDGVPTVFYDIYVSGFKAGKCDLRLKK